MAPRERRLFIQTAALLGSIRISLWMFRFEEVQRFLSKKSSGPPAEEVPHPLSVGQIVHLIDSASRCLIGTRNCLVLALATQVLLKRAGHPTLLRVGVVLDHNRRLKAHAWIESGGQVLWNGKDSHPFTPLPAFGGEKFVP